MHGMKVREAAFKMYCSNLSAAEIAVRLTEQFPAMSVSYKTVEKWISDKGWRKRRENVQAKAQDENDAMTAEQLSDDLSIANSMIEKLQTEFMAMDAMSLEGAAAQLRMAIKLRRELMGLDGKGAGALTRGNLVKVLEMIKRAMGRVPAIAEVMKVPEVQARLQEEIEVEFGAQEN